MQTAKRRVMFVKPKIAERIHLNRAGISWQSEDSHSAQSQMLGTAKSGCTRKTSGQCDLSEVPAVTHHLQHLYSCVA
ncbi:hypothetical protein TorRG33x02_331140 [Trema orientale]|uniref:Uncharacterized protein n=1 Tax=Trema orientale TaxID=63057 RepID=A0A2P5B655_TREOI|nr:hypothetical protein TorRG33x02_331140 [Trema orientale]